MANRLFKNLSKTLLENSAYDKESNTYIHNWLDGKEAESRKEYLRQYKLDLDKI